MSNVKWFYKSFKIVKYLEKCIDYFVHESYRLLFSNKISFIRSLAIRYGGSIWLQYDTASISLSIFNETSARFLANWMDERGRVNISVERTLDQRQDRIRKVNNMKGINFKTHFCLQVKTLIETYCCVFSRKSRLSSIFKLLQIVHGCKFIIIFDQQLESDYAPTNIQCISIKPHPKYLPLLQIPSITSCQLLSGLTTHKDTWQIYLIEESTILHRLSISYNSQQHSYQLYQHQYSQLPCIPSQNLDQDLFYLHSDDLRNVIVGYSITKYGISIKYYTTMGKSMYIQKSEWHEGKIEFRVNDLFCIKKTPKNGPILSRIFYIHESNNFMDIEKVCCDGFYPARLAFNSSSDGSGLFAIWSQWQQKVYVYKFKNKHPICQIKIESTKISNIFFSHNGNEERIIGIDCDNKVLELYNLKGKKLGNILYRPWMKNFFFIGNTLISCSDSLFYQFQVDKKWEWKEPEYIPINCGIIDIKNGNVLNPTQDLQFSQIQGFYFYCNQ